jgi:hypothetical protein
MGISLQDATAIVTNNALRTQYGLILPPGARVAAYVRSTGIQSGDDAFLAQNLCSTLAQGLARARSGMGDFVVCLPGHTESVADATTFSAALVAGTKIIGVGRGSNMPTFTWTATGSQWLISVNDVQIAGIRIQPIGITAVVLPISITGADCAINYCEFVVSTTAIAPTNVVTVAATGLRTDISGNKFRGLAASVPTSIITVAGAVTDVSISDNEFNCPAVAATGHVNVTGAALGVKMFRNQMYNTAAASTVCISFAAAVSDGHVADNRFCILANGVASATGITFGAGSLVKANQNFCTDEPQRSGVLSPVVVAT